MAIQKRKRYIAFEIISENNFTLQEIRNAILREAAKHNLEGVFLLPERYNTEKRIGLIKVGHKSALKLREVLNNMQEINNKQAKIKTLGTSGTVKTASRKYLPMNKNKTKI